MAAKATKARGGKSKAAPRPPAKGGNTSKAGGRKAVVQNFPRPQGPGLKPSVIFNPRPGSFPRPGGGAGPKPPISRPTPAGGGGPLRGGTFMPKPTSGKPPKSGPGSAPRPKPKPGPGGSPRPLPPVGPGGPILMPYTGGGKTMPGGRPGPVAPTTSIKPPSRSDTKRKGRVY